MEKVLMKGNEALAEAAIRAGCRHFFGYPITPQTEVAAYMSKRMPKVGGVFLQGESEVASINMVYGAAGAGARVMTSSSSPGISLMSEGISYLAASDLPCVIVNIVRSGPGLGGIQPAQSDYFQATKGGGHGDYHILVYAPSTVQELVTLTQKAFDVSDAYRVPALIMGDGMLGQMMEPVSFEDKEPSSIIEKPWATTGHKHKRPKNVVNSLHIEPDELEPLVVERYERYQKIQENETMVETEGTEDADIIIVAYGTMARVAKNAISSLRKDGIKVGLIRPITLWPFPYDTIKKAAQHTKCILTVEMSTGQMLEDVKLGAENIVPVHFYGRTGGTVPLPDEIIREVKKYVGGAK